MASCHFTMIVLCVILCCFPVSFTFDCQKSCKEPLGMESKGIKDYQITASSSFNNDPTMYGPHKARLNLASWPPGYRANPEMLQFPWITVDLGTEKVITGMATQGYGDTSAREWVTSYTVSYKSKTGDLLQLPSMQEGQPFRGNRDSNSITHHDFPFPIVTSLLHFFPKTWADNVGFRFELYGCDPGYYFVVWRLFDGRLFTPKHAVVTSEEYIDTKREALQEIEVYLGTFPGYFYAELATISPQRDPFGIPVLTAEMKTFCLKSSENNLAAKLNMEIKYRFVSFRFPVTCQCSYPQVNISLKKTIDEATVMYTTQNTTFHAETRRGNCHKSVSFKWEIAKASDESSEFGNIVAHGDTFNETGKLELKGRELDESYLYIRCTAFIKKPSGEIKVETYDYGYVRVTYPPLIARITGGMTATKGNGSVTLDASSSYDPHTPGDNIIGLTFSWYCQRMRAHNVTEPRGCYGYHPGKLMSREPMFIVDVDRMDANHTYLFELVVSKDRRVSRTFHTVTVEPPYVILLRCTVNCGRKIATKRRMIIEATCRGPYCLEDITYSWTLYQLSVLANSSSWLEVQNLQNYILTNMDSTNIVFSGSSKPLKQSTKYRVIASVILRGKIIVRGEMVFFTNSPPHTPHGELGCSVYPKKGFVLQTKFNVTCYGWEDVDVPLSYQLSYRSPEGLVILCSGNASSFTTLLPLGNQSENYQVKLEMQIFDSFGDATTVHFSVQVGPLSQAEVTAAVNMAIYGPNSTTAKLLRSGNLQTAALTSYFALTATEDTELSAVETNSAKDEVLRQLVKARPQMLQEVTQLSVVVNKATQRRSYVSVGTVVRLSNEYYKSSKLSATEISPSDHGNAVTLLKSMTNHLHTEASSSEAIDEINQVGGGLLTGMSNVLNILPKTVVAEAKHAERHSGKPKKEKPRMSEEVVTQVDSLGTTLLSTKVVGEVKPSVFKTELISLVLDRQTPSMLVKKPLQYDGSSSGVSFPSSKVLTQNLPSHVHPLDAQMITFKSNPFVWDKSSKYVTSDVMDVSIKANGVNYHLSKLEQPFELYIPLKQQTRQVTDGGFFVKWSKNFENIRYHKIIIPSEREVAIIDIVTIENHLLKVFISAGFRPTPNNYSYSTYVPNYSICKNMTTSKGHQQCSNISPYRLMVSSNLTGATGNHYVGILLHNSSSEGLRMNDTSNKGVDHSRHSRSLCNTKSGRKKRSCIGVKDPPTNPPPTPKVIKPEYNPNDDVNYTMSVSISSCLYWSKEKQQWTNDGCRVGSNANPETLHCLCTHLSSFGGDLFVTANPIDFDVVWFEFGKLGHTLHFVTAVVLLMYGVYLVGLLLARRADNRDQDKVVGNVVIGGCDQAGYIYEIYIETGIWKGFGTTANVGINIFGEETSSGPFVLTDFSHYKKAFSRGSVSNFIVCLPCSLGRLVKICIWHDNFGHSPSWFLQQVIITEVHTGSKWYFFANKWIAVERGSGNLLLELEALDEDQRAGFKYLFYSKMSRSLGDKHLWVSLFTRPPQSPFTRCQRLSCCLSFLFTSMVVNAMFYQFSNKPTHTFKFGPLVLSWKQFFIGIQSGFIAIPVNMLIVALFRNMKPYFETVYDPKFTASAKERSCKLPRCFVFAAWIACILVTLTSSALTVFYSLYWGTEISNQWLTSIIISLVEDVVFNQPVKVIIIAMLSSLVIGTSPGKEDVHGTTVYIDKAQEYNAPNECMLSKAKEYGRNLLEMGKAIKNVVAFLVFFLLLMVVCYGNRDSRGFLMNASVKDVFRGFGKVTDKNSFWVWTKSKLVPGLYHVSWSDSEPFNNKEGLRSKRKAFLIGMPRLRQVRLKQENMCRGDTDTFQENEVLKRCLLPYSEDNEDKSKYYQPRWVSVKNLTIFSNNLKLYDICPKPWRYQSPHMLGNLPYQGVINEYDGGGYVAELGYNKQSALDTITTLENNGWIDKFTAAVFIEFSVHEPSSRLFSFSKYLYERLPTGGVVTSVNVKTLALYPPFNGSFNAVYKLCQLLFVVCILIIFFMETIELIHQKKAYFTKFWNWVHMLQILSSTSAVIIGLLKAKKTSLYVKKVQSNPYGNVSSDHLARLFDYENYLLAGVIFIVTIRLLKLVKFNPHICQMAATLRRSGRSLISFAVVYLNSLLAFSLAGVLTFGINMASFSSFYRSLETVSQMSIGGNVNFAEMKLHHGILAPLFMSTFVIWMVFILGNVFVAILVDFYTIEREKAVCSNGSLVSFIYFYFLGKARKFKKLFFSNVKSKVVKQRKQYSRTHWKRAAKKIIERQQHDQTTEPISPSHKLDTSHSNKLCTNADKFDAIVKCMQSNDMVICPEINITGNISNRRRNENRNVNLLKANSIDTIPSNSEVTLYSNDDEIAIIPATSHMGLSLDCLEFELSRNDLDQVKSDIVQVTLELNKMLTEFKKTH